MLLKKVFDKETIEESRKLIEKAQAVGRNGLTETERKQYDAAVADAFDHVKVVRGPEIGEAQNFSTKFVEKQQASGLLTMDKNTIVLNTVPPMKFRIVRRPGYYCCHDDAPMDDDKSAKAYLEQHFKGKPSPDRNNPAGYRRDNFYSCERVESEQRASKVGRL